jgi:hypothetical protein
MKYAEGTSVPVVKSRIEIEMLIRKAGAVKMAVAEEPGSAAVYFELANRKVMFRCAMPSNESVRALLKKKQQWTYRAVPDGEVQKRREAIERERWRALLLCIKSKFVSIETDVETFDEAFLPHILVAGGTVGEQIIRGLDEASRGIGGMLRLGAGT